MARAATRITLIRHASSAPDDNIPDAEWPLSEKGRAQAKVLAAELAPLGIARILSSPYRRAVDTVQPLADRLGLEISLVPDLRERKLTNGLRSDWEDILRRAWADFSFALPGCESGLAAQARVCHVLRDAAINYHGETIAVASHGNAIGLFLNAIDPAFGFDQWRAMKNPEIFHLAWDGAGWRRNDP
jgi:2,3-bisphosphoglycerate-dependent phosphoglycerate mutase